MNRTDLLSTKRKDINAEMLDKLPKMQIIAISSSVGPIVCIHGRLNLVIIPSSVNMSVRSERYQLFET
jgi:hypothetical protein